MNKKILAIGPYIGDFENELITFLPYARWLHSIVDFDNIYINTHYNRHFLYDFINKENIISINESLTRDELNQKGYVHKCLSPKEFGKIIKNFKNKIIEKEECSKKEIDVYYLNYVKSTPPYSIYNKIFNEINISNFINIPEEHKNRIILIPDKKEDLKRLLYIYDFLKEYYDCIVIGDMKTFFPEKNVILSNVDYFENGIQYILKYISEAKAIICPTGFWTSVCNILHKPVFSWGVNPGQHRKNGIYNFYNDKCSVIPADGDTDMASIIKNMGFFLKNLK